MDHRIIGAGLVEDGLSEGEIERLGGAVREPLEPLAWIDTGPEVGLTVAMERRTLSRFEADLPDPHVVVLEPQGRPDVVVRLPPLEFGIEPLDVVRPRSSTAHRASSLAIGNGRC